MDNPLSTFTSFEVAVLFNAYKNNRAALARLESDSPNLVDIAKARLQTDGYMTADFTLTAKGKALMGAALNQSVAMLIEFGPMTDQEINDTKEFILRHLGEKLDRSAHVVQVQRFNPEHGGVVIYQP